MHPVHQLSNSEDLAVAATAVARGQLVVVVTDTVYGLAADPRNQAAMAALFAAKDRPLSLPVPVLVADPVQASYLTTGLSESAAALIEAFWPGPLTLILPVNRAAGLHLGVSHGTVALRQPNHPRTVDLLDLTGPLAVTSANLTGLRPAVTVAAARHQLGTAVAHYLDGGTAPGGQPSSIVDLTGPDPKLVRSGPVSWEAVSQVLNRPGPKALG
ncbi:MAG: threonylcarbamoyl-AMP synthase [Bifidobacteriaceae bacterium]|jgi:tRNA threonylcarbamoyl adenosine modification protein (Sua5/YciO/YrdC/YwlC family)|nr:threonylcarbamoyl-AMP synthase [Bifidobacteriaceae bacterium]